MIVFRSYTETQKGKMHFVGGKYEAETLELAINNLHNRAQTY